MTLYDPLSSGLQQVRGVGRVGLPGDVLPVPVVVTIFTGVSVVVLRAAQETVETVKAAPGWPVFLIAEAKMPLQGNLKLLFKKKIKNCFKKSILVSSFLPDNMS